MSRWRRLQPNVDSGLQVAGLVLAFLFGVGGGVVVDSQVLERTTTETVTSPPSVSTTTETVTVTTPSASGTTTSCTPRSDQPELPREAAALAVGASCEAEITTYDDVDYFVLEGEEGLQVELTITKDPKPTEGEGIYFELRGGGDSAEGDLYGGDEPYEIPYTLGPDPAILKISDACGDPPGCGQGTYVIDFEAVE